VALDRVVALLLAMTALLLPAPLQKIDR
jgi:hypothetical protein